MRKTIPLLTLIFLVLMAGALSQSQATASSADTPGVPDLPAPASLSGARAETIARNHLLARAADYGVSRADLAGLLVIINYADSVTGARYVKFVQTLGGITVENAVLNVTVLPDESVVFVGNRAVAGLEKNANSATPALTQPEAIAAAADALGLGYSPATVMQVRAVGGAEREIRYAGGDLSLEPIPVKLAYQPAEDGSLRLAWDLNIYQRDAQHWWDVRVDALTGEMLDKGDWVISENWDALLNDPNQIPTGALPARHSLTPTFAETLVAPHAPSMVGSYRVYQIPVESPNHSTPAAPADGRQLIANPDLPSASPFGWHDTNGVAGAEFTTTQGNNAHAYTDVDANNTPDAGSSPDGTAALIFDFPLDLTLAPSGYRPAAVTNLFYWNNLMHDIPHLYGFNEAAGNFQENNYGNGGLGSDYVNAEAQDGSGTNNANFSTPPDGSNPRMQMYIWTAPNPDRDGDLDNGIIAHEYGHGISNRLTGTGPGCLSNAEQMGEGWSDWQAVLLTMRTGDTATTNRGVGTYALNQPTTGVGIRPAPYNTDFGVNNYTYANLPAMAVPHGVGFVWNTMLWEMNWELINDYGFEANIYDTSPITGGGNILAYKLVQDGMAIQPCDPGFVDGRDAILAADVALTGGDNECAIWRAFARRGLGFSASQGSPNSTADGTAATDLPPQCIAAPDIDVSPATVSETHTSGTLVTTRTLTIGNPGTDTLDWTIVEDATLAPASPATTGQIAPAPRDNRLSAGGSGVMASRFVQTGVMARSLGGVNLVLDDGTPEDSIGLTSGGEFLWFNRFTPNPADFPFTLTEIQLYTIGTSACNTTDAIDFYVWTDADGNPANGATFAGSLTGQTVGTLDQFNTYAVNIPLTGPGDVLIGVVNRGCDLAGQFPATIDTSASQVRSWVGFGATPGNPPTLPMPTMGTIDSFGFPGNWTIRGVGGAGSACPAPDNIPWLTVSPASGSTPAGDSTPVTLTFDSTSLLPGTYTGDLCIESNDPDENPVTVPVSLTVSDATPTPTETATATATSEPPTPTATATGPTLRELFLPLTRRDN